MWYFLHVIHRMNTLYFFLSNASDLVNLVANFLIFLHQSFCAERIEEENFCIDNLIAVITIVNNGSFEK